MQEHLTYLGDGIELLEIEPLLHYAIKSDSEPDIYRNITVQITYEDNEEYIQLECDCPSGFFRGVRKTCKHKKKVLKLITRLLRERRVIENHIPFDIG